MAYSGTDKRDQMIQALRGAVTPLMQDCGAGIDSVPSKLWDGSQPMNVNNWASYNLPPYYTQKCTDTGVSQMRRFPATAKVQLFEGVTGNVQGHFAYKFNCPGGAGASAVQTLACPDVLTAAAGVASIIPGYIGLAGAAIGAACGVVPIFGGK